MPVHPSKTRGVLIAGNWKMNHGPSETETFFREMKVLSDSKLKPQDLKLLESGQLRACLIPPTISLPTARHLASQAIFEVAIAAQNAHWELKGAYTGEVSGPMLKDLQIDWALVGHSERRQHFGETDETVRRRMESLLDQGFRVILCVGETRAEREAGRTHEVLSSQMHGAIPEPGKGAARYLDGRLVIAYEPVWAIGTGLTATPAQAEETQHQLRQLLQGRFGGGAATRTPVLYGGSVTPENIDSLLACPNVDGALVGGASLKPDSFLALLAAGGRALGG